MFPIFPGYQLEQKIYESSRTAVYRGQMKRDGCPVVLKVLQPGQDTPEAHGRFRQEYHLTAALTGSSAIRALALEEQNGLLAMALEDFGGQSLAYWLNGGSLDMATFLPLAIHTSDALAAIHQQNLIHKDINPANIVWNRDTAVLKIIDFGLASTLPRENPELRSPNVLEGTLAYISPEQTGRMNRAMDYRSDLYSLGITFYQLATGELPFTAVDPLELIHAHIARPPPPATRNRRAHPATLGRHHPAPAGQKRRRPLPVRLRPQSRSGRVLAAMAKQPRHLPLSPGRA